MAHKKQYSLEEAKRKVDGYIHNITQHIHIVSSEGGTLRLLLYLGEKTFAAAWKVSWRTVKKSFSACISPFTARFRADPAAIKEEVTVFEPEA